MLKKGKGQNTDQLGFNFLKCSNVPGVKQGLFLTFWVDSDHQSQDVITGYFRNQSRNMAVCEAMVGPKCQIMGIKS